jgi:hypothetical protein
MSEISNDVRRMAQSAFEGFDLSKYHGASNLSVLDWRAVMRLRRHALEWADDGTWSWKSPDQQAPAIVGRIAADPLSTFMLNEKTYEPTVTELNVVDACGFRDELAYLRPDLFETLQRLEASEAPGERIDLADATPKQISALLKRMTETRELRDQLSVSYRSAMEKANISDGLCNLVVDCSAPDDVLTAHFLDWLAEYRKQTGKISGISETAVKRWAQHRVLPYIDLKIFSAAAGIETTNFSLGSKVFPDIDADVAEKVRKTTAPLAEWLLGPQGEDVINAIANDAQRKLIGKNWG